MAGVCRLAAPSRSRLGMDACVDREELWVRLIRGRSRKHPNGRTRSAPVEAWAGAWERTALLERSPALFFLMLRPLVVAALAGLEGPGKGEAYQFGFCATPEPTAEDAAGCPKYGSDCGNKR